jgi:hypothetical protein
MTLRILLILQTFVQSEELESLPSRSDVAGSAYHVLGYQCLCHFEAFYYGFFGQL